MSENQGQLYSRFGKKIPAGTALFHEGDKGEEMFIVQSGKVKISKTIRGVEKTLATLEKGEFFGEMAILNDKPRSASAETVEESEMLVISRKTFDALLRSNVEIAIRFIKRLADRLRETNDQMEGLMIKDNTGRLVSILATQIKEQKKGGIFAITIENLAGISGIELSQVKAVTEKLESAGILELSGNIVLIPKQEQVDRLLKFLEMREMFGEMV